jgi:hypothetical protein
VFALFLLCFLLPFATVSCDSAKTSFTGIQLVTRTVPSGGKVDEGADCSTDLSVCVERQGSFSAEVAVIAASIGCLLALFGIQKGPGWCAGAAFAAMLELGWASAASLADVNFHAGFKCALALSAWAAVLHLVRAVRRRRAAKAQLE